MPQSKNGKITLLGYACDLGTSQAGAKKGPEQIINSESMPRLNNLISDYECFYPTGRARGIEALPFLHDINVRLATTTENLSRAGKYFVTLGGDHSSAIGTWSGASSGVAKHGDLGLIWFDAHMDSHTPETTPSDNIHGMPLATLLGYGDPSLTSVRTSTPKIKPEHLCLIGVRSYEAEEKKLLEHLNVRIFYMEEINERGIEIVLSEALTIASTGTAGYGISFDLDALDPIEAPGVGTPEPKGLSSKPLFNALKSCNNHPSLIGLEIAEFNPTLDKNHQTEEIIFDLIETLFSKT
ncbi:MAG: arginase [Gammaproteobacteria bacterium]|nr:arginase [Gammaproteobacteria bacterium]